MDLLELDCGANLRPGSVSCPKQNSSGDKIRLGGISKQGGRYLRCLLVVGATAVIRHTRVKETPVTLWLQELLENKPVRPVSVALANKTARIAMQSLCEARDIDHINSANLDVNSGVKLQPESQQNW